MLRNITGDAYQHIDNHGSHPSPTTRLHGRIDDGKYERSAPPWTRKDIRLQPSFYQRLSGIQAATSSISTLKYRAFHFSPHFPYTLCHFVSLLVRCSIISTLLKEAKSCSVMPSESDKIELTLLTPPPSWTSTLVLCSCPLMAMQLLSRGEVVLVDGLIVGIGLVPAISTWVWEMNSKMPATRRFMSFIVVRLGFMCRGLEGLPTALLSAMVIPLRRVVVP